MLTDSQGHLLVLGGYGRAGGNQPISSFAGADTWHDDISDGPVTCRLWLTGGQVIELDAWVTTGYLLSSTAVTPIGGKLGDRFGRKPMLIGGSVFFLAMTLPVSIG